MERDNRYRYYHGGLGAEENRRDFDRNTRDGDFGRAYEDRYRGGKYNHYRNEDDRSRKYRSRDYEMEDNYYRNVRGERHELDDIRQGYGFPGFSRSSDDYDDVRGRMERERNAQRQQGYGSGRMGGYSGSGFGGANYSAHGSFGGASEYGAMSGGRGNADDYVSSSGYGGGYGKGSMHMGRGGDTWNRAGDRYSSGRSAHDHRYTSEERDFDRRNNTRYHQRW